MAISTDALVFFDGTQDEVTAASPGSVANDAFSAAADTVDWTNDDDAPLAAAVLKAQFVTTMPTAGSVNLYSQPKAIQSTNDPPEPSANYGREFLGVFAIPFGVAADTDFWVPIPLIALPWLQTSQVLHFFIENAGTGQTIAAGWQLWITPVTQGPHG